MGIAIRCILQQDIDHLPHLEGKSLAMAYCGDPSDETVGDNSASANIITIDFGGAKPPTPPSTPTPAVSLLAPLDPFIAGDGGTQWHDAARGLAAVRRILKKLREGATVAVAPDFPFGGENDEELTAGVQFDLEVLEQLLIAAQKARSGFYLAFEV